MTKKQVVKIIKDNQENGKGNSQVLVYKNGRSWEIEKQPHFKPNYVEKRKGVVFVRLSTLKEVWSLKNYTILFDSDWQCGRSTDMSSLYKYCL